MRAGGNILVAAALFAGCSASDPLVRAPAGLAPADLIPAPAAVTLNSGEWTATRADVGVTTAEPTFIGVAAFLARELGSTVGGDAIRLVRRDEAALGTEGYRLVVTPDGVEIAAATAAGAFHATRTLRQLLPANIGPSWRVPALEIFDRPRYAWRGYMLDVARHFFGPEDVRRLVDVLAGMHVNVLHLHLSDDQGWRIEIPGWPRLTTVGGASEVDGGPGGYYTVTEYTALVDYAAERYITVVPEIDMPGHIHAALVAYPELSCDGEPRAPYTGTDVGFSALCATAQPVTRFISDVYTAIAALTPGAYIHVGGDEAHATSDADYAVILSRIAATVESVGKQVVGWQEILRAPLPTTVVAQIWLGGLSATDVPQGASLVLSPAERTYLDMGHNENEAFGAFWAGSIEVRDAYLWDPEDIVPGASAQLLGVEAPLWTERVADLARVEHLTFPRMLAIAEVGWSPAERRDWLDFRRRLAHHGPRFESAGVQFYRSPQIDWE